jgi:cytochrome c oxidase assembly protein subunit 15
MRSFKRVAAASAGATFLLVTIGGLVRATKSGLGCGTDWPHCSGRLVPALENRAMVIEYSHRFVAGVVIVLLATLMVMAFRSRQPARIKRASVGAFGLVMFQAILGMIVVILELQAVSVVLHLGTAMALLALVLYIAIYSGERASQERDPALSRRASIAAASVILLLLVGSYVSGSGAGYVFPDWPLMDGRVIPDLAVEGKAIHFLHRGLAAITGGIVLWAVVGVFRRQNEMPSAYRLAHTALGLFAIEVAIGAGNVFTRGNDAFVTLHLAMGAAIWATLVSLAFVTRPAHEEVAVRRVGSSEPALEGR